MLTILLGTDWTQNRSYLLDLLARDIQQEKGGRILIVPELISHDTERRLCAVGGDTTSRFAEVLSFTRLANRVSESVGHGMHECLDSGGRVIVMAAAARQMHSKLKAYASVETKPEFLTGLVDVIDEFKRCCISAEDLRRAALKTEGSLAQKLEELSLLLEAYDSLCSRGKRDPRDQMSWLLEQLEDSDFARNHVFYIDGFPDFTRQHMAILNHFICNAPHTIISMNCDIPASKKLAFEKAGDTTSEIIRFAKQAGVEVQILQIPSRNDALRPVRESVFQGSTEHCPIENLEVTHAASIYDECLIAAQRVMELVRSGSRYRDIGIVCSDMRVYQNAVNMVFQRCRIPVYQSGTESILEKPVITTVLAAIDVALSGFDQHDVIRYLKSTLSPLEPEICDRIENYAIMWSIQSNRWLSEWTNHPDGLGQEVTDVSSNQLKALNQARSQALAPLVCLRDSFKDATNLRDQVSAVYRFLNDIALAKRLDVLAEEMETAGDSRNAQILNQLWEILLSALEQMYDVLGQIIWDTETFCKLLRLLLSQYDVGTIPPVLDAVMVGPVSAMRCQQQDHLIVLGAAEGYLPGYAGSAGVLTDSERTALRELGVPLTGGAIEGLQAEFAEIYGVFCGAQKSISVSYPAEQPSFIYRRLLALAGRENVPCQPYASSVADAFEAAAFLTRYNAQDLAESLHLADICDDLRNKCGHTIGVIEKDSIKQLYGAKLKLSASQIDLQADCRLAYFMKYGLHAKELKSITVDPAEFGTYVHAVLELTARDVMAKGGFRCVSLEETLRIAQVHSDAYAAERFAELDSQRLQYLFQRNCQELLLVVQELWQEMQTSRFVPLDFELHFDDYSEMRAIPFSGHDMEARLRGVVDRVDVWQENGQNYFRVVDYKTGKKNFDYCDVFNGLGLQMLLYLFALEDEGETRLGSSPIPAGVQYFPARVPLISADGMLTEEEARAAREKEWKRRGLLLSDEDVLLAMEPEGAPKRLNYTRRKDGSIAGDLANRDQFRLLKAYIFRLLGKMVDEISSGCVEPNPYTRGNSHNACSYCPYGAVCHPESVEQRRDYKTMSSQRFWEEVEKEMKKHG